MLTSDFSYQLPPELIAQHPLAERDHSRMMVCNRHGMQRANRSFQELPSFLKAEDVMVINQSRVIPARLLGEKLDTGVPVELLLLTRISTHRWEAMVKPGRRLKPGAQISFGQGRLTAAVGRSLPAGTREIDFSFDGVFEAVLDELGEMPLPPYIHERLLDRERYQTVYAKLDGSAAAPTAGLHFTPEMLERILAQGTDIVPLTLHVGLGTFRPVKAARVEEHHMHSEHYALSEDAANRINAARARGGRILCVGTTSLRTLETLADDQGILHAGEGETDIFITPGYRFKACDLLLTNFHLPESTLLMLVSALMGREEALAAYQEAVRERYRFFSFGDCMLIGEGLL